MNDEPGLIKGVSEQPSDRTPGLALKRWTAPKVIASSVGSTASGGVLLRDISVTERGRGVPVS
jgi:hypothetical protein